MKFVHFGERVGKSFCKVHLYTFVLVYTRLCSDPTLGGWQVLLQMPLGSCSTSG